MGVYRQQAEVDMVLTGRKLYDHLRKLTKVAGVVDPVWVDNHTTRILPKVVEGLEKEAKTGRAYACLTSLVRSNLDAPTQAQMQAVKKEVLCRLGLAVRAGDSIDDYWTYVAWGD
jgi:hypothetical protein